MMKSLPLSCRQIVVLLVSFTGLGFAFGMLQTFGIMYVEFHHSFAVSKSLLAWTGALNSMCLYLPGSLASWLVSRVGPRWVIVIGAVCISSGMVIASVAPAFWLVALGYGAVAGVGGCFLSLASFLVLPRYFEKRLTAATAFATMGTAVVTVALPFVMRPLIAAYGWRLAVSWYACLMMQLCVLAMFIGDDNSAEGNKQKGGTSVQPSEMSPQNGCQKEVEKKLNNNRVTPEESPAMLSGSAPLLQRARHECLNGHLSTSISHIKSHNHLHSTSNLSVKYLTLGGSFVALEKSPSLCSSVTHKERGRWKEPTFSQSQLIDTFVYSTDTLKTSIRHSKYAAFKSLSVYILAFAYFGWTIELAVFFQHFAEFVDTLYESSSRDETLYLFISFSVGTIVTSLSMLIWADKVGEYQASAFGIGSVLLGLADIAVGYATNFVVHIGLFFLVGVSLASMRGFLTKACIQVLNLESLEFVFGLMYVSSGLGGIVGPLVAGKLFDVMGNNFPLVNSLSACLQIISGLILSVRGFQIGWKKSLQQRKDVEKDSVSVK